MVQQVTCGIKISVVTNFEGSFYKNYKMQYAFAYTVTIENQSKDSVQLFARHWEILDALNNHNPIYYLPILLAFLKSIICHFVSNSQFLIRPHCIEVMC